MSLTKFCCCCDLRRGCIVFAWLQMMSITMIIATLIACIDKITLYITEYSKFNNSNDDFSRYFSISSDINLALQISIASLFIKAVTCIALTWGVIKKCHLLYQPWLFISGIEAVVSSVGVLIFFILACILDPIFFMGFFFYGGCTALDWYFWACVYTVYKRDIKPSSISYEMQYDNFDQPATLL